MSNEFPVAGAGLQVFKFEDRETRVVTVDGELWWVAKDVAEVLGYSDASVQGINKLIGLVPEDWKGRKPIPTPGGVQDMFCLSEQGLYFFLNRSDKPKALPYQKWIAGEVVPTMRRMIGV